MSTQPGPPSAPPPAGSPSRPGASGGFRRTHVIAADGSTVGASPPAGPPPSHRSGAVIPEQATTSDSDSDTSSSTSSPSSSSDPSEMRQRQEREAAARAEAQAESGEHRKKRKHRKHRHNDEGGDEADAPAPSALTAGAVDRAFGVTGSENTAGPAGGGASAAAPLLIQPTTKDGNDAMSMYSMSQSILPVDPRDRLYYRPRRHLLQCYLKRKKDGNILKQMLPVKSCSYQFFLEHTNDFVLAARQHTSKSGTKAEDISDGIQGQSYSVKGFGNIVFSVNSQMIEKDPRSFVGKISRRHYGSETVLFSEGSKGSRKEICAVRFEKMQDGQRRLKVILPAIDEETGFIRPLEGGQVKFLRDGRGTTLYGASMADNGSRAGIAAALQSSDDDEVEDDGLSVAPSIAPEFKPTGAGEMDATTPGKKRKMAAHSLLVREYLRNPRSPNIVVLMNKPAKWDTVLRGYQLDFHGRATKASEKNFQLVPMFQQDKVVMLFGKQGDERYAVDFRYPLCGLQAAAVATTMMAARSI